MGHSNHGSTRPGDHSTSNPPDPSIDTLNPTTHRRPLTAGDRRHRRRTGYQSGRSCRNADRRLDRRGQTSASCTGARTRVHLPTEPRLRETPPRVSRPLRRPGVSLGAAEGRLGQQAPQSGGSTWSTAGDEGQNDVGRVLAVEVLAAPVVDGRRPEGQRAARVTQTSRRGTPASRAAMMKAALSMWGM